MLKEIGKRAILVCYENNNEFCHRHIIAYYLEFILNIEVPEVKIDSNGKITRLERPKYIRNILYSIIKEDIIKSQSIVKSNKIKVMK